MYNRFIFVENIIRNSPKIPTAKFLEGGRLFSFITICKFGSFKNPFATIAHGVKRARTRTYCGPRFSRIFPDSDCLQRDIVFGPNAGKSRKIVGKITPNTNSFYAVTSMYELYLRFRRFVLLVQTKKLISVSYGNSKSS